MSAASIGEVLEQVKDFADKAHGEQERKYTAERYIAHPMRVMETCRKYTDDVTILAAALLHDVLEDTEVSTEEMLEFLEKMMGHDNAARTVKLVEELTDIYTKTNYPKWNRRKRKSKEADRIEATSAASQLVKYADIIDNTSEIVTQDPDFAKVFLHECRTLLRRMSKGNRELYAQAVVCVNERLKQLKERQ